MTTTKWKTAAAGLRSEEYAAFKEYCIKHNVTPASVIRTFIRKLVDDEKKIEYVLEGENGLG